MQAQLEEIIRQFQADTGSIHLLEDGVLILKAQVGLPPHIAEIVSRVPIGKGMAGLAFERNEPVSSCNIQSDQAAVCGPALKTQASTEPLSCPSATPAAKRMARSASASAAPTTIRRKRPRACWPWQRSLSDQ